MNKIGLIDVDSHGFPNLAIMKISAFHKSKGDIVRWAGFEDNDTTYISKIFTFSEEPSSTFGKWGNVIKGGTGYDVKKTLPEEIESCDPDYSIYKYPFSIQFFSRGCIRHCPFCLVNEKEGNIKAVDPMKLNPKGKWLEVLDNNFFANPEWKTAINYLINVNQPINLHGVDIRIMNEEQAFWLNKLKLKGQIHIAWDLPKIDLKQKLNEVVKYINPNKLMCYVLIGYNSTIEQDMYRIEILRELRIDPFIMPYRSLYNNVKPEQYHRDLARYVNNKALFNSMEFKDYSPRKGFKCAQYLKEK
jgi:hypothetical protein